ncbi:MAG TPA: Nramp family divalent metal transporter [Planctomycetaceae bacterium]|nr:Nramp family divalent metal transporter [Planctomycetaceae bacterium]
MSLDSTSSPADEQPETEPPRNETIDAPTDFFGILKRLGPGLIIAGSIVGSGELIATTKTGAQAGITLLWLIVLGCLIKVFVQIELGRYAITHGETTLIALNRVPGPRAKVNWIVWFWLFMMLCTIGQLGGIVGGVGQALAISVPVNGDYRRAVQIPSNAELTRYYARGKYLLSEWDFQLLEEAGSLLSDNSRKPHEIDWLLSNQTNTTELLNRVSDEQQLNELTAAYSRVSEIQQQNPHLPGVLSSPSEELIAARAKLQLSLNEVNRQLLAARAQEETADETLKILLAMNEAQRERVLRGHAILSAQLADVDADEHRGITAMSAIVVHLNRTAELKTLEKSPEASPAELEQAKAAVDEAKTLIATWVEPETIDDKFWAGIATAITIALLWFGRYNMLQNVSTVLVVAFTFITIGNVVSLQFTEQWSISLDQFLHGLSAQLPERVPGEVNPLVTALAAFGIIGVGATELITYPYWCLEKGYAKWTGKRSDDQAWSKRAKGWMRVMLYDALFSMVIYTVATIAFYVMGVAVLFNEGRDPDGMRMVSTLASAYVPVFGAYAGWLFLGGAIAVLYSTFLIANAGNARMYTDGCEVFGVIAKGNLKSHDRAIRFFSVLIPLLSFSMYMTGANPVTLVLVSGMAQAMMLPMIGLGAIYFRYRMTDERLKPSKLWDAMIIISCLGFLMTGVWGVYTNFSNLIKMLTG